MIIDNQLGRRNITPEQKSYLRGKRYHVEKKAEGRPAGKLPEKQGETAERLAKEYRVGRDTIEKDGQFAEAVDTLEEEVKQDIRASVLKRKSREDALRWILNNQLGRRNLDPLAKEALIGRRYELEQRQGERTDITSRQNGEKSGTTAERIAAEYQVSPRTVERAGDLVKGLDALKEIREDLPKSILTKRSHQQTKGKGKPKVTKARVGDCNAHRVCNLRGSAAWSDVF